MPTNRLLANSQEKTVTIMEVNTDKRYILVRDNYGSQFQVQTAWLDPVLVVPEVGETWTVYKTGSTSWALNKKFDNGSETFPFEQLSPGDVRIQGNNIYIDGTNVEIPGFIGGSSTGSAVPITQTAHGFSLGDILYFNGTNYAKAQADNSTHAEVLGIVSNVGDSNHFTLTTSGLVTGLSSLTPGQTYWLDPTTAGRLTSTEPTASGQIDKPLLIATSSTSGYFVNYRGFVVSSFSQAQPRFTTSAFSSGPPSSPNDGDIWVATGVDTNGTRWHFQYNASSAQTTKWEFVGGPPLTLLFSGADTFWTSYTSLGGGWYTNLAACAWITPRTGDYIVSASAGLRGNSSVTTTHYLGTMVNSVPLAGLANADISPTFLGQLAFTGAVVNVIAGQTVGAAWAASSISGQKVEYVCVNIIPRRII